MNLKNKIFEIVDDLCEVNINSEKILVEKYLSLSIKRDCLGEGSLSADEQYFLAEEAQRFADEFTAIKADAVFFIRYTRNNKISWAQPGYSKNNDDHFLLTVPESCESEFQVRGNLNQKQDATYYKNMNNGLRTEFKKMMCTVFNPKSMDFIAEAGNLLHGKLLRQECIDEILSILEDNTGEYFEMMQEEFVNRYGLGSPQIEEAIGRQYKNIIGCLKINDLDDTQLERYENLKIERKILSKDYIFKPANGKKINLKTNEKQIPEDNDEVDDSFFENLGARCE